MANVVIKRCPFCPTIKSQVDGFVQILAAVMGAYARVEDVQNGELSVFVDGVPVIQRTSDNLPNTDELRPP